MFNIATGLTIWCSEALTLAAVLYFAWRHDRKSVAFLTWALGFFISAVGFGMTAARDSIPDILSIHFGNGISLLGESAWIAGFRQMDKRRVQWIALAPPLVWAAGILLPWVADSFANRVVLYELSGAVGATLLAMAVLPHGEHTERSRTYLGVIFVLLASANFLDALTMVVTYPTAESALAYRGFAALSNALLITTGIVVSGRLLMERSERRWHALSITDHLTSVFNRRGLQERFAGMTQTADRSKKMAALLFDLDHFKRINDRHGHQAGDHVLREFARLAKGLVPPNGIFGRMGGEEFISFVIVGDQTEAEVIAEMIRADFCRVPLLAGGSLIPASVSSGIAILPIAEAQWDHLVSAADRALYAAKEAGRNCTVVFGEEEAAKATSTPPDPNGGELVPTLDDQIHALRRMGTISRM